MTEQDITGSNPSINELDLTSEITMEKVMQATTELPLSIKQLLEAGVHFGHQTNRWNPKMKSYIFGARNGIHIIDLQQTAQLFQKAYQFVVNTVANGGSILFVGTKKQCQDLVQEEARRADMFYVTNRWLGGTLTNFRTVCESISRLKDIEKMGADGTFERLGKKEVLVKQRELEKLEKALGGIKNMDKLPDALFIIDAPKEHLAITEAKKLNIPVIAIGDTNANPDVINFLIPGNDDAIRSVQLIVSKIADACIEGARLAKSRSVREHQERQERTTTTSTEPNPPVETIRRRGKPSSKPAAAATPNSVTVSHAETNEENEEPRNKRR